MKSLICIIVLCFSFNFAHAGDAEDAKAWLFSSTQGQDCDNGEDSWTADEPAQKHEISYQTPWSEEDQVYTFYSVLCYGGAYNFTYLYVAEDEYATGGYRVLSFTEPSVNYVMVPGMSEEFGEIDVLKSWSLEGFYSVSYLVNADYNEETKTIHTFAKGRGIGDAFSSNTYAFKNGSWLLTRSVVDPTFDGQIDPVTVFEVE